MTGVAGVVGYAAGQVLDNLAVERAARAHESVNQSWDLALANTNVVLPRASLAQRTGRRVVAPLAIVLGVGTGLSADAWMPNSAPTFSSVPHLELVVDHSGATGLPVNGSPVTGEINTVVNQFSATHKISTEALVATNGTVVPLRVDQVSANRAFGEAKLADATEQALDRTAEVTPVLGDQGEKRDAAILVITNGNPIGQTAQVVAATKQQHNTPIFVVNVEGAGAEAATTQSLEAIAQQTGGQYWDAHQSNLSEVSKAVEKTVVATETDDNNGNSDKNVLKVLGALLLVGAEEIFRRRRGMPYDRNAQGV